MLRTSPIAKIALLVFSLSFATLAQNPSTLKESAKAAHMRQLNNQILNLHAQMQSAQSESSRKQLRGQAFQALKTRQAALVALMKENPKAALTFAFSQEALDELSTKFPESDAFLEEHVKTMGEVEHWIADYPKGRSESIYLLRSGDSPVRLHFAGPEPTLAHGDVLAITGVLIGSDMVVEASAVESNLTSSAIVPSRQYQNGLLLEVFAGMLLPFLGGTGLQRKIRESAKQLVVMALIPVLVLFNSMASFAQSSCSTTGDQNTAVLLVNLPGGTLPSGVTAQSVSDIFFGTSTGVSVDGFIRDASYGQATVSGSVFGPYNLTGTYSSCSDVSGAILNDTLTAAIAAGVNLNNYSRVFLVFPNVLGCTWSGFGNVGGCSLYSSSGTFNATISYLTADALINRNTGVAYGSHELGHNLGLQHSGIVTTSSSTDVLGPISSPGTLWDQGGDYWSTMGEQVLGLYPAPPKAEVLGWMGLNSNYKVVQGNGSYTLQPLETSPAGLQALKVQRGTGNSAWLWVEYRQPIGLYDSTLAPQPFSGALIHYEDSSTSPAHTYLPNFTPSDTTRWSPAIAAGQTWTDPYSNVSISVSNATTTSVTVSVTYGASACVSAAPSVSLSPVDPTIYPGAAANYTLSLTNNDSSGCSTRTFNLASSQPSGWGTSFSATSVSVGPGQSASVSMNKISPSSTSPGIYAVDITAADSTSGSSSSANVSVMSAPTVTAVVSVSASSYTRKSTVPITATVMNGSSPVSGAGVVFTLVKADGSKVQQSATTGSRGKANWNYKLNVKYPTGTYSVSAQVTLPSSGAAASQSISTNTITFTVQ